MGKLFESAIGPDVGVKARTESSYEYLRRSGRPEILAIREELEKWFRLFPHEAKPDLRARFRSKDDRNHSGAFFELYIFRFLERQGYSVKPHVSVNDMNTKPDFLVCKNNIPSFYMECTVCGQSNRDYAGHARLNSLYEAIDAIDSPDFFLGASVQNNPAVPISAKKIKKELLKWLSTLDPDMVMKGSDFDGQRPPSIICSIDGWEIEFVAFPKKAEFRGKAGMPTLGMEFGGAQWVNCKGPLRDALKSKATKYGGMDFSYIIAVNLIDPIEYPDHDDITQVLFGEVKYSIDLYDNSLTPYRESNGFWINHGKPVHTRVSGTLIGTGLMPWTMCSRAPALWHNPWTKLPLNPELWRGNQKVLDCSSGLMKDLDGRSTSEIFGLDEKWPIHHETKVQDALRC